MQKRRQEADRAPDFIVAGDTAAIVGGEKNRSLAALGENNRERGLEAKALLAEPR